MARYPVTLTREGSHVLVVFPGFPHVHTYGNDEAQALRHAADALETYFIGMIRDGRVIPPPRRARAGEHTVSVSAAMEKRIELYRMQGKIPRLRGKLKWRGDLDAMRTD